jgi:aspartate aminotransferase-like enzyme
MVPPGLALISLNGRAWAANKASRMHRYYWDFAKAKKSALSSQTPIRPPFHSSMLCGSPSG